MQQAEPIPSLVPSLRRGNPTAYGSKRCQVAKPRCHAAKPRCHATAGGFTLIEILIVITIIAILAALLVPSVMFLHNLAKRLDTEHRMESLRTAFGQHLVEQGCLGPRLDGLHLLDDYVEPLSAAGHLEQVNKYCATVDANDMVKLVPPDEATHWVDAWGDAILAQVKNDPTEGDADRFMTSEIYIRSLAGSASEIDDDIVYRYSLVRRGWENVFMLSDSTEEYWYVDTVD